jgi:hypothetical protein
VSREHSRQKKLQRKRRKRQHKLLARRPNEPVIELLDGFPSIGMPKVSDTIVEFARPLIDELPDDCSGERVETVLMFAASVWNAALAANGDLATAVHTVMTSDKNPLPNEAKPTVEFLVQRKQQHFAHDWRAIAQVQAYRDGGEIRVMAAGVL